METNFEGGADMGGPVSGGTGSTPMGSGSMDTGGQNLEAENVFEAPAVEQTIFDAESPKMTSLDYLKDGVDKGYYKVENEGSFSLEEVLSSAQTEMEKDDSPDRQIMDLPGTAHDKLEAFSQTDDEPESDEVETINSEEVNNEPGGLETTSLQEFSPEQQIMALQAEAIKILAKALREGKSQVDKQELEELIKKLKELLEKSQKADGGKEQKESKKGVVMGTTLSLLGLMFALSEKALNEVEEAGRN